MRVAYRVVHKRRSAPEAMFNAVWNGGRYSTDAYLAQNKRWYGWKTLGTYDSAEEAERCCSDHAGGDLLAYGGRSVSEFSRRAWE